MKALKIVGLVIGAALLLVIVLPKKELYYLLENELKKQKIVLSSEVLEDFWLGLEVKNGTLYYEEIKVGEIESIKLYPLIFWNSVSLKNLTAGSDAVTILPKNTKEISVYYSIIDPLNIRIYGNGDFGVLKGSASLLENNISLELNATDHLKSSYPQIVGKMKLNNGVYRYEQTIK